MGYDAARGTPILVEQYVSGGGGLATWKSDGKGWIKLDPAHPAPWPYSNLTFDLAQSELVMIAGPIGTGWLWGWDGTSWRSVPSTTVPGCTVGGQFYLTFDAAHNRLLLLCNADSQSMSTWLFDGAAWTKASSTLNPTPRYWAGMAYDPRNHTVLLTGGKDPMGTRNIAETWTWNGESWTKHDLAVQPAGPVALAYDSTGRSMVLFEQLTPGMLSPGSDWTWSGSIWTKGGPAPPHGTFATLCDDPQRAGLLLFEGSGLEKPGSQTWLRVSGAWRRQS